MTSEPHAQERGCFWFLVVLCWEGGSALEDLARPFTARLFSTGTSLTTLFGFYVFRSLLQRRLAACLLSLATAEVPN